MVLLLQLGEYFRGPGRFSADADWQQRFIKVSRGIRYHKALSGVLGLERCEYVSRPSKSQDDVAA